MTQSGQTDFPSDFGVLNAGAAESQIYNNFYHTEYVTKRRILTQGTCDTKHACREQSTCKSCTHVEESNPSLMHDKFRAPQLSLAEGTSSTKLDRFQSEA